MQFAHDYIQEILRILPSECAYIDYKQTPYFKHQYHDLIKDTIAMLNSEEAIGKDKAIIFGIVNDSLELKGIDTVLRQSNEKFDDANYQTIFDHIHPRPTINVGTTVFQDLTFGYVYISGNENTDWIYEVGKTLISKGNAALSSALEKHAVFKGQSFFRRGSKNYVMMNEDRARIKGICIQKAKQIPYYSTTKNAAGKSVDSLTFAAAIGKWCEDNQNDRSIIEAISGQEYETWIQPLRKLRESGDQSISFSNNVWEVKNSTEVLESTGIQLYDVHFEAIESQISQVFSDINTKFDLEQDQRYAAGLYRKGPRFSNAIRHGLSEFLAILGNFLTYFPSCSQWKPKKLISNIIAQVLGATDWRILATMEEYFSLLAEADPATFSQEIQVNIKKRDSGIIQYLFEKETGLSTIHYGHNIVNALALIACRQEFFSNACYAIFLISKYNSEFLRRLTTVLLPWNPKTDAPIEHRIAIVREFLNEDCSLAWKLLLSLLPGQTTVSASFDPPKYLSYNIKNDNKSPQTYWEESTGYLELAIDMVNGDVEKILNLIDFLNKVPKDIFLKILHTAKCIAVTSDDEIKYTIWNKLLSLSCRHRKFLNKDHALPEEALKEIDLTVKSIAPLSRQVQMRRLFLKNSSDILPVRSNDYQKEAIELLSLQKAELQWCYNTYGLTEVVKCMQSFERTDVVGICLAELDFTEECDHEVCSWLTSHDTKLVRMAQNYIPKRFAACSYSWVKKRIAAPCGGDVC